MNSYLRGYINITQLAVKQILMQNSAGSVTCVTTAMVELPIASINASVAMVTKGGLEVITRSLAMEYAKEDIRFNAVAYARADAPTLWPNIKERITTTCRKLHGHLTRNTDS